MAFLCSWRFLGTCVLLFAYGDALFQVTQLDLDIETARANSELERRQIQYQLRRREVQEFIDVGDAAVRLRHFDHARRAYSQAIASLSPVIASTTMETPANAATVVVDDHFDDVYVKLGSCQMVLHLHEEALASFEAAVRVNPANQRAQHLLGLNYQVLSRADDARAAYLRSISLNPNYALSHHNLGLLLREEGRHLEAIKHFKLAARINPLLTDAHVGRGRALIDLGKPSATLDVGTSFTTVNSHEPAVMMMMASAAILTHDDAMALKLYLRANHTAWRVPDGANKLRSGYTTCQVCGALDFLHNKADLLSLLTRQKLDYAPPTWLLSDLTNSTLLKLVKEANTSLPSLIVKPVRADLTRGISLVCLSPEEVLLREKVLRQQQEASVGVSAFDVYLRSVADDGQVAENAIAVTKKVIAPCPPGTACVVQRYIARPMLWAGRKFDVRIFVVVTSARPLRLYVLEDGIVRFADANFTHAPSDCHDMNVHATTEHGHHQEHGLSIDHSDTLHVHHHNSRCASRQYPRTLHKLQRELAAAGRAQLPLDEMEDMVTNTFAAAAMSKQGTAASIFEERLAQRCYKVYAVDFLIDEDVRPWLLEVNAHASLSSSGACADEARVKANIANATLLLATASLRYKLEGDGDNQLDATMRRRTMAFRDFWLSEYGDADATTENAEAEAIAMSAFDEAEWELHAIRQAALLDMPSRPPAATRKPVMRRLFPSGDVAGGSEVVTRFGGSELERVLAAFEESSHGRGSSGGGGKKMRKRTEL